MISFWNILIVVVVLVLLFGRGKISGVMSDIAKGIRNFKTNLRDDDPKEPAPKPLELEAERRPEPHRSSEDSRVG